MENFNIDKNFFFINVKIFWESCKFPDTKNYPIRRKLPQTFSWMERKGTACMCQNILECIYANAIITSVIIHALLITCMILRPSCCWNFNNLCFLNLKGLIAISQEYIVLSAMEYICIQATTRQPDISINWYTNTRHIYSKIEKCTYYQNVGGKYPYTCQNVGDKYPYTLPVTQSLVTFFSTHVGM